MYTETSCTSFREFLLLVLIQPSCVWMPLQLSRLCRLYISIDMHKPGICKYNKMGRLTHICDYALVLHRGGKQQDALHNNDMFAVASENSRSLCTFRSYFPIKEFVLRQGPRNTDTKGRNLIALVVSLGRFLSKQQWKHYE